MHRLKQSATRVDRSARVIGYLCSLIRAGTLRAGDQIPSETELAEALRVRGIHVRDGIACLRMLGILRAGPRAGLVLGDGPPQMLLHLLSTLHVSRPRDITEARQLISIQLAGLAALRSTPSDHMAMAEDVAAMYAATSANEHMVHAVRFRQRVANSSGNSLLAAFAEALLLPLSEESEKIAEVPLDLRESARMYRELYRAIRRRQPSEARKAVEEYERSALRGSEFRPCTAKKEEMPRKTGT
jgi:DNA-binding FadR family transcriptional regulator